MVALGLVVLSTASEANGYRLFNDARHFIVRQAAFVCAGIVLAAAVAAFDYRKWRDTIFPAAAFYGIVLVLLVLVFKYPKINGSQRWIPLGPVNLQPAEFAKASIAIFLCAWLDKAGPGVERFVRGALWPGVFVAGFAVPVILEPDFGSVMVIGAVSALAMLLGGTKIVHLIAGGCIAAPAFLYRLFNNANRMARLAAFLGIDIAGGGGAADESAKRAAYQAEQALVAFGNGGISGTGLGESMQKHFYLPEAHTDFIFAIGGEELGIAFSVGVILLFAAFFILSIRIAVKAADNFGRNIVMCMAFLIFFQAMFNIGVVCKALPTKGMALPFFSYGGTNMLASFLAVGMIFSVGIHSAAKERKAVLRKVICNR